MNDAGNTASYMISARNIPAFSGIELEFEVNGDFLSSKEFNLQNDFVFLSDGNYNTPIYWSYIGNRWIGKALLYNADGLGYNASNASGFFDILELVFNVGEGKLGITEVKLNSAKLSYEGANVWCAVLDGVVSTEFVFKFDVNRDGVVDLNDITFALQYLLVNQFDAEWAQAYVADVNGEGVINAADLSLILANYTIPYYG